MFVTLPLPTANADPNEALRQYIEACQGYSNADIDLAVKQFLSGSVKGQNPDFAPTPARFVTQLRANLDYRASSIQSQNKLLEQFKDQELDEEWASKRTPEAKAKVQSMLEAIRDQNKPDKRTPEEIQKAKDDLAKQDQFFADQFIESPSGVPVSKSLAKLLGVTSFDSREEDDFDLGDMR